MAATATKLMAVRAGILERMVVVLERAKHGALARAVRARAEHLAAVAQGIEGKVEYVFTPHFCIIYGGARWNRRGFDFLLTRRRVAKLKIAATLYTPETVAALERYKVHLRDVRARLEEERGLAVEELGRYGDVGGSGDGGALVEIARQYGELVREVENVRMEIARLGE
jgi:diphthamide biosynthesis protein 3